MQNPLARGVVQAKTVLLWLWANARWLFWDGDARLVWLTVLVLAVAFVAIKLNGAGEPDFRIAGGLLQIAGILTVIVGIHKTRKIFNHPSYWEVICKWWKRRPRWGKQPISAAAHVRATLDGVIANGFVGDLTVSGASIEQRVKALEKRVAIIDKRVTDAATEMQKRFSDYDGRIQHEAQTRSKEDSVISARLESAATGGVYISLMGAAWLIVGVAISALAPELAYWVS